VALRLSGITDVNILNAFRDIEDKLDELNSRQAPEAEVRAADVDDIHTKLDELALATKPDSFNIMMGAGPMSKPGYVPNPGLTSVFSDRVLHANGDWASPLNGRLTLTPTNQGGRSIAQDTAILNGSIHVNGTVDADTVNCRLLNDRATWCYLTKSADASPGVADQYNSVPWDTETFDTNDMHSNTSNNSRITVVTPGVWIFDANVATQQAAVTKYVKILKNGATTLAIFGGYLGGNVGLETMHISAIDYAIATDYYEVQTYFVTTALTVNTAVSHFAAIRLSA